MTQQRSRIVARQLLALAEEATLYQQTPRVYNETVHEWEPGATVAVSILVVAQPPSEAVAANVLPEGTRVSGAFKFYIAHDANVAPLRTGAMPTGRDLIRYQGVNYRVASVQPWYGDHLVVIAIRLDTQDGPIPAGAPGLALSGGDVAESDGVRVVA